ncbi:MAG: sugar ABC transporter substrate-binding protein [Chloroflexi bacterium]|nr:sugar ABC transporter substrate-binding protein [Chloroflexota bacterium]
MYKNNRSYLLIAILLAVGIGLSACQPAATPTPVPTPTPKPTEAAKPTAPPAPTAAPKKLTFALVTKALNNPFWDMMYAGAKQVAEEHGIELIYLAPTKPNNLEEQTRLVDDLIARKVDGIVLVPVDSAGIVPVIERANQAGIPVATANTKAFGGKVITFSAIENYEAMTLVAEYMVQKLGGKGKVVILEGATGSQTAIDRKKAIDDVLAKYPGIQVLASQTADFQRAKGMQVMENLLQTYPEIDAVLACNDEMALGAIEALEAAGRLSKTLVSGFDANNDALKAIYEGRMVVSCDQRPGKQAGDAILALIDYINGKPVPERIVTQATVVDKSNIMDYASRLGL